MHQILGRVSGIEAWIFVAAVIVAAAIVNRIIHWTIAVRVRRLKPEQHMWRHAILAALDAPLRSLVWLVALVLIKNKFIPKGTSPAVDRIFIPAVGVVFILIITWFLLRVVRHAKSNHVARTLSRNEAVDQTALDAFSKLACALIVVFALISILGKLGVSLASLLAFGGAAGIAVGFAAQTLVANIFGGLTIYISHIFKIGDYITLPGNNGLSGTVEYIGWRATVVRAWNGQPSYVPNSLFNTTTVANMTRMNHRMISEYILLRYRDVDKVQAIVEEGNELLKNRKDISYFVFRFDSFSEGALKIYVYAYVQNLETGGFLPYGDFMRIKEEVLLAVVDIARNHGCELILPTTNLYLPEGRQTAAAGPLAGLEVGAPPPEPLPAGRSQSATANEAEPS